MLSKEDQKKIRDFASKHRAIVAVYLFGSIASGRNRPASDIDLSIIIRDAIDGMQKIKLETTLSNLLSRDVDLKIFSRSSPLLQHQILKNGHLIYESDLNERVRQEVFARSEYLDTKHLFKEIS